MPRYVALLKGVNVGGNKKVSMAELRSTLSGLGFSDVGTVLQSGNAVFATDGPGPEKLARQVEDAVAGSFGMTVRCLVRTGDELRSVIDAHPLAGVATDGSRMLALFLSASPDPALLAAHPPADLAPDDVRVGDRVIYQWCPDGILAAPDVSGFVERNLKVTVTGRNWNTVCKLSAMLER